jgi:hypothetical protein
MKALLIISILISSIELMADNQVNMCSINKVYECEGFCKVSGSNE